MPLANRFAVRASIAYKGCWIRRTRTFAGDAIAVRPVFRAEGWFDQIATLIFAGKPLAEQIAAHVKKLPGAVLRSWMAESCVGSYPLQVVAASNVERSEAPISGSLLVLTLELAIDGVPWLGTSPVIVGGSL